ncbi:hypothetical protein [Agarivorans gilvus]|uniref:Uncharacterized protein n=1 Tax=Agarivorans gilvus TaxID=680279 RepID=A0ABQ1I542_9ALTE|nr:hypothetical protein [Agarivorans gilvus]GGB10917.1 hypothetical protein GCM10007414_25410 [Agarivorans gilvus]
MKIYGKQYVETMIDSVCDVCGESLMVDVNGHKIEEAGKLNAQWGYGSKEDGSCYHLDLCEGCFKIALSALKEHRRSIVMFDKSQELPDESFGIDKSKVSFKS